MRIVACVQARMSSVRLPGKVLKLLNGMPMIHYTMQALEQVKGLDGIVLATSDHETDDALEDFCQNQEYACFRGSLEDVTNRTLLCAERYHADAVVRISGDSPLVNVSVIERAIKLYRGGDWALVTNIAERSYPKGLSVEVISVGDLKVSYEANLSDYEKEHVTPWIYKHSNRILNISHDINLSEVQLSVDTLEDFFLISRMISGMSLPHWQYTVSELLLLRNKALSNG